MYGTPDQRGGGPPHTVWLPYRRAENARERNGERGSVMKHTAAPSNKPFDQELRHLVQECFSMLRTRRLDGGCWLDAQVSLFRHLEAPEQQPEGEKDDLE